VSLLLNFVHAAVRATLAVVFGFMSLSHGPVMAFAKANAPLAAHEIMTEPVAGHHHDPAPGTLANDRQEQLAPQTHEGVAICYSTGCFLVVPPVPIGAPAVLLSLLEQLRAAPGRAMVPAVADPLVPPPRLQA
jgi:hypothetical protein